MARVVRPPPCSEWRGMVVAIDGLAMRSFERKNARFALISKLTIKLYVPATGDRTVHAPRCGALAPSCLGGRLVSYLAGYTPV